MSSTARKLNSRQQGDLGETSAIEWLTRMGATVLFPIGHSPNYDMVADTHGRLLKIQVKTSTQVATTPRGHQRFKVALATRGGNRSWNGTTKTVDPARVDYLFALTSMGRRWFIPASMLAGQFTIALGGEKYAEYEIEPTWPIAELVLAADPALKFDFHSGEYPSGQRTAAVNRQAQPSQVRLLPPPFRARPGFGPSKYDRALGKNDLAILNQKRRVTLPRQACIDAGLQDGDSVHVRSNGDGRILLERIEPPPAKS